MNYIKRAHFKLINIFVFAIVLCFFIAGTAGCAKEGPKMTSGDFVYCYINGTSSNFRAQDGENVAILELTESGKQKETIIIPDYIDGKPVVQIGMEGIGWSNGIGGRGSIYKKLYLPKNIITIKDSRYASYDTKVLLRDLINLDFLKNKSGITYISKSLYDTFDAEYGIDSARDTLHIANVTYVSGDELYWIDNCGDDDKLVAPIQPVRDGYSFAGWYKDTSFLSEWNFETDTFETDLANPSMVLQAKWLLV